MRILTPRHRSHRSPTAALTTSRFLAIAGLCCFSPVGAGQPPAAPAAAPPAAPANNKPNNIPDSPGLQITSDALMARLRALPTQRAAWGGPANIAGLEKTEALMADWAKDLGFQPTRHAFRWGNRGTPPREWGNILFDIKGREKPDEIIILGAHFDAVPGSPGADDNGTGVAALFEIARVLKDRPLRRTVRFIAFNVEEAGLIGSTAYVESFRQDRKQSGETLVGMVSLEMLGFFSDEPGSQQHPFPILKDAFPIPDRGNFLGIGAVKTARRFTRMFAEGMDAFRDETGQPGGVPLVVFDHSPVILPDLLRSDHGPFLLAGFQALIIADTANFRNPHYHMPTDSVDTIDTNRFTRATRAIAHSTWRLAGPVGQPDAPEPQPVPELELPFPLGPKKPNAPAGPASVPAAPSPAPTPDSTPAPASPK